jgi:precorrin-2/cobalt-factor-2 C20-methyltransferase
VPLGTLYGISTGPGDPELITIKSLRLLQSVPIVAFPAGRDGKLGIAQQTISRYLHSDQVTLALDFPFVQDAATLALAWHKAARVVWIYLCQGQDVAFATEGDVSFYSTFTYLAQTLQQIHPDAIIDAVPGVCSPLSAIAALGLPLTVQDQRLLILPALYHVAEFETAIQQADVLVLMKVSSVYQQIWQILQRHQLLDRSYVVERASQPDQIIHVGLRDRPNLCLPYFSLLIVQVSDGKIKPGEFNNCLSNEQP